MTRMLSEEQKRQATDERIVTLGVGELVEDLQHLRAKLVELEGRAKQVQASGDGLVCRLLDRGLTHTDMSRLLGVTAQSVRKMEVRGRDT